MGVPSVLESPQDFFKPLVLKTFNHTVPKRPLALMDPNVNAGNSRDEKGGNDGRKRGGHDGHGLSGGAEDMVDDVDDMPPLVDNPFPSAIAHPSSSFPAQGMPPYSPAFSPSMPQTSPGPPLSRSAASPRGVTPVQFTFAMNLTPSAYAPHATSDGGGGAAWRAAGATGVNDVNLEIASGVGSPMGADSNFRLANAPLPSGMTIAMMPEAGDVDEDDDMPPLVDRPPEAEANTWNSSQRFADNDFANPIAKHHNDLMDEDDEDDEVESNSMSFNSSFPSPLRSPSSPATSPSYSVSPWAGQAGVGPGGYSFSHQFPASPPGLEAKPNFSFEMTAPGGNGNNSNAQKKSSARPASYIPRPPNAFILFRASFVRAHSANASGGASANVPMSTSVSGTHRMPSPQRGSSSVGVTAGSANSSTAGVGSTNLSKLAGQAWRALPASEREVWERKALAAQAEHRKKYPDWRFRPGNVSGLQIRDGGGGGSGSGSGDPGGGGKETKEKGSPRKSQNQESKDRRSPGAATTSSSGSSSKKRARNANINVAPGSPTTHHIGSFSSSPRALGQDIHIAAPLATENVTSSASGGRSPSGSKKRSRKSSDASTTSNISAVSNASAGSTSSVRSAKRSRNASSESVASAAKATEERSSPRANSPPASSLASSSTVKAEAQQPFLSSPTCSNASVQPEASISSFRPILEHQPQSSPIAPSMLFEHYPPVRPSPVLADSPSRGGSPLETPVVPPLPPHPSDGIVPMQRNTNINAMGSSSPPLSASTRPFAGFPVQRGTEVTQARTQHAPSPLASRFGTEANYPSSSVVANATPSTYTNSVTFNGGLAPVEIPNVNPNGQAGIPAIASTSAAQQNQQPHLSTYSTLEGWAGGMSPQAILQQNPFVFATETAQPSQHNGGYQAPSVWYHAPAYINGANSAAAGAAPASSSVGVTQRQLGIDTRAGPSTGQQAQSHAVYPEMRQEDQYAFLSDGTYLLQDYYSSLESGGLQLPQK